MPHDSEPPAPADSSEPAPLLLLLLAAMVDGALLATPALLVVAVANHSSNNDLVGALVAAGVPLVTFLCYQSLLMAKTSQSLGKRTFGLVVVRANGSSIRGPAAVARFLGPLLVAGAPLLGLGVLFLLWPLLASLSPGVVKWVEEITTFRTARSCGIFAMAAFAVDGLPMLRSNHRCLHDEIAETDVSLSPAPPPVNHLALVGYSAAAAALLGVAVFAAFIVGVLVYGLVLFFRFFGHMG
jgi:uncharacterized RDD family membrane protein YckC